MNAAAPEGLRFSGAVRLGAQDAGIAKVVTGARYVIAFARSVLSPLGGEAWLAERVMSALARPEIKLRREIGGLAKYVDVRAYLVQASIGDESAKKMVASAGFVGDLVLLDARVKIPGSGAVKTVEIVEGITGEKDLPHRAMRAALVHERDGVLVDPLDLANLSWKKTAPEPVEQVVAGSA